MEKIKKQHFIYLILLVAVFSTAIRPLLYGQDFMSRERENEIKMSGKYYWGEGSDFVEEMAKLIAFVELSNQIIQDAVGQSEQLDEILKAIDMGAHLERLPLQGKNKILAWIAKDSVLLTVTNQRPITRNEPQPPPAAPAIQGQQESDPQPEPEQELTSAPQPELESIHELNPVTTGNIVLQELSSCKTYNEVRRVATINGLVRGQIGAGSIGFLNPENCIIAVFNSNGMLLALLDTGGNSRMDILSGNTVSNPEQYYNREGYYLMYMQQKNTGGTNTQTQTVQQQPQTFNTTHFVINGDAKQYSYNGRSFIGDINTQNGLRLDFRSDAATATISLVYRSDNRGGKLIVNGMIQNIDFPSTNWDWGTKVIQGVRLNQGLNTIQFFGGYKTEYGPDIAEITIK